MKKALFAWSAMLLLIMIPTVSSAARYNVLNADRYFRGSSFIHHNSQLFIQNEEGIYRMNLDGSDFTMITPDERRWQQRSNPVIVGDDMYAMSGDRRSQLERINLSTGDIEPVGVFSGTSLGNLQHHGDYIYFTGEQQDGVMRYSLTDRSCGGDGLQCEPFATDDSLYRITDTPCAGVLIDGSKIYGTSFRGGSLYTFDIDGLNPQALATLTEPMSEVTFMVRLPMDCLAILSRRLPATSMATSSVMLTISTRFLPPVI